MIMAGNKRKTKTIPIKFVDVYLDDAQIEQFKNGGYVIEDAPQVDNYKNGGNNNCPKGFQEDPVTGDCMPISEKKQDVQEVPNSIVQKPLGYQEPLVNPTAYVNGYRGNNPKMYKYGFLDSDQGNIIGGGGFGFPKSGVHLSALGVVPTSPNDRQYFKGVYEAGISKDFKNLNLGLGVNTAITGYPGENGFVKDPIKLQPKLNLRYNFQEGGLLPKADNGGEYSYGDRDYKKDTKGNWSVSVKGVWTPLSQNVEARTKELNKNAKFVRELQGYNPNQSSRYDMMASNKPQVADNTKVVKEIPDNRTFAEINEDNKFKATKKKIESDFDKATKYYEDYHESPMYKSMLNNSMRPGEDASFFSDNRSFNLTSLVTPTILRTQPIGEENTGGWSNSRTGNITVTPLGYKVRGLLPHEISHSIDRPRDKTSNRLIPYKDRTAITKFKPKSFITSPRFKTLSVDDRDALINNIEGNKDFLKTRQEWIDEIGRDTETRGRLNDIRMQSKEKGIYDPFTQKVSPDTYKKLLKTKFETGEEKKFDALQQLKGIYTDEQIRWMLNNISKNEGNAEELPYTQKGGLVNQAKKSYIDVELSARDIAKYKALGFKIKDLT